MKAPNGIFHRQFKNIRVAGYIALFVIAWEVVSHTIISSFFLPPPSEVVNYMFTGFMMDRVSETASIIALGYPLSIGIGLIIGFLIAYYQPLRKSVYPILFSLKAIPSTGIAVLLVIWVGTGLFMKVIIVVYASFFPVLVNAVSGLTRIKYDYVEMMESIQASKLTIFRKLLFPNALPHIVTGLKSAVPQCVTGIIVAEIFAGNTGLGYALVSAISVMDMPTMFAALVWMGLTGLIVFGLIFLAERLSSPWYLKRY